MKDYDLNEESLYLKYWDVKSLYGWEMLQKLPVNNSQWRNDEFNFYKDFIRNYDGDSDKEYILEVNVKYLKELYRRHSNMSCLPNKMKINKCEKLECIFFDQENYVIHIKALMQMLNIPWINTEESTQSNKI